MVDKEPTTQGNRNIILASQKAGCLLCTSCYDASEVTAYTDEGETALCPVCGLDGVIGDAEGIEMTEITLVALNEFFCGGYRWPKGKAYKVIEVD